MELIDAAIEYASMGFKVFPARLTPVVIKGEWKKLKIPMTNNGHLDASTDPVEVELMFRGMHECNKPGSRTRVPDILGMVHDRFLVVDIDCKHGKPGFESYEQIRPHLPKPLARVRTNSGGAHFYFPNPRDPKLNVRDIDFLPGLDILAGAKGWIGVPPSEGYTFVYGDMRSVHEALAGRS